MIAGSGHGSNHRICRKGGEQVPRFPPKQLTLACKRCLGVHGGIVLHVDLAASETCAYNLHPRSKIKMRRRKDTSPHLDTLMCSSREQPPASCIRNLYTHTIWSRVPAMKHLSETKRGLLQLKACQLIEH
mmetsp:Transcript_10174/g.62017  ORF Transcript_10174/g.62017 Transcript_10174/m.62017 type:complete len:130 (-) Transcript_10174:1672-2061(-)